MRYKKYKRLTKEDLIKEGINIELDEAASDIKVYRNGKPVKLSTNKQGYLFFNIYDRDEKGNKIKKPTKYKYKDKIYDSYTYKSRKIMLHRAVYAWIKGSIPDDKVIDHISNKHASIEDNFPENLQAITQRANSNKDKQREAKPLKCDMSKPRGFYEEQLDEYERLYETALQEGDKEACRRYSLSVCRFKARLKYWDAHADEFSRNLK